MGCGDDRDIANTEKEQIVTYNILYYVMYYKILYYSNTANLCGTNWQHQVQGMHWRTKSCHEL